jgi:hypothetical protein
MKPLGMGILSLAALLSAAVPAATPPAPGMAPGSADPPQGLFELYARNRSEGVASDVTADLLLVAYALVREDRLVHEERKTLLPLLERIIAGLAQGLGADDSPAGRANRDFLAVLEALVKGAPAPLGPADPRRAAAELKRVREARAPARAPLWERPLDYGALRPRGHYAGSPALSRYFQASAYAAAVLFPVRESRATGVTAALADRLAAQARALGRCLAGTPRLLADYRRLDQALAWSFGPAEDLTLDDLLAADRRAGPAPAQLRAALARRAQEQHRWPRILSQGVEPASL